MVYRVIHYHREDAFRETLFEVYLNYLGQEFDCLLRAYNYCLALGDSNWPVQAPNLYLMSAGSRNLKIFCECVEYYIKLDFLLCLLSMEQYLLSQILAHSKIRCRHSTLMLN